MLRKFANPAWAVVEYLWYPILVFAATPYFLKTLGAAQYGLWMLLTATVGVGTILNVGTGAATIKLVSESIGRGALEGLNDVVASALAVALLGGGILALVVLGVFQFGGDFLFAKMGDRQLVLLTGVVAALLGWIEQIDNVFSSAAKGAEKFGNVARVEIASKALQIAAALAVVAIGGRLEFLFGSLVAVSLVRLTAKARLARSLLGINSLRPKLGESRNFLLLSKWGWLQGLGAMFFASADRFLVGSMFGATTLAQYSVASMLPQQIHAIAAAGMSVIFPMVSRKRASATSFSLARTTLVMFAANAALGGVIAAGLWFAGERIFAIWLRDPLPSEALVTFKYLVVAYFLLALSIVPHYILLGLGKMRFVALNACFAGVVAILTMVWLANNLGLTGVGAGRVFYGALYGVVVCAAFLPSMQKAWRKNL